MKGRIAIRIATSLGQSATIDFTYEGGVVGEQALLPPVGRRSATAVAVEPTETMALSATDFADAARPSTRRSTACCSRSSCAATARSAARLAEALSVSAETRVLRRLFDVAATYASADGGDIVVPLTQEDLAGLAGTTRETVNRVLRQEAERGLIALGRGRITVLDRIGLERRAR